VSDDVHDPEEAERSLAQRTLDALLFAPAGLLLTAVEDLPEMAAKGRSRLDVQVRNARLLGQFAVTFGRRDLGRRLARLAASREEVPGDGHGAPEPRHGSEPSGRGTTAPPAAHAVPPAAANLAIPDYDTLSASQVVRRLDGLGPQELHAVYQHESATRRRRTILHRAQQLLGSEDVPGL
jgi:hypothetical protein